MYNDKCIKAPVESTEEAMKRGVKVFKYPDTKRGARRTTTKVDLNTIDRSILPPELRRLLDSLKGGTK